MKCGFTRIVLLGSLVAVSGCGSALSDQPAASPALTRQAECERHGGWWHADSNFCEYEDEGPHLHRR